MNLSLADFRSLRWSGGGQPVTRLVSQRLGAVLAWIAYRFGLTPSQVTLSGTLVFLISAWLYARLPQGLGPSIAVLALLQLGYGLDCADGQLARATQQTSTFGAWLDVACDYVRNIVLAAAITFWLTRQGLGLPQALLSSTALLAGLAVQLYTGTFLARHAPGSKSPEEANSPVRTLIATFIDTTTQLSVLSLLRLEPVLLSVYSALTGMLYVALAWFLVKRRLAAAHNTSQ